MNKLERIALKLAEFKQTEEKMNELRAGSLTLKMAGFPTAVVQLERHAVYLKVNPLGFQEMDALCDWWRSLREETGDDW